MIGIGICRPLDSQARLHIPKDLRKRLDLHPHTMVEIFATTRGVYIRPFHGRGLEPNELQIDALEM